MSALDGMRVLDLTEFEAGPACTQALAWLGADVVKVEPPGRGDPARGADWARHQAYASDFCAWNANKRSLAIDLDTERGRALFLRLVERFDVLVENLGPGGMERLRLTDETLRDANPELIYARIKGFGGSGPYADFAVRSPVAQAAAGAFSINGRPGQAPAIPASLTDAAAGAYAAMVVLAAWIEKLRTGKGRKIDLSMQEALTFYVRGRAALGSVWGARVARRPGGMVAVRLAGLYPCKPFGANDYIYLLPITEGDWVALCQAMGRPELRADLRFYSARWRFQNGRALYREITAWTSQRTKIEAMETIAAAGVPCGACLDTMEVLQDRHLLARGFIEDLDLPVHGNVRVPGFAPRMSKSRVPMTPPPRLGEHSDEVLCGELGLDEAEVEALADEGVIGGAG